MRIMLLGRKCHANVKDGDAEWIEGRRKPVEAVCVGNAMIVGGWVRDLGRHH